MSIHKLQRWMANQGYYPVTEPVTELSLHQRVDVGLLASGYQYRCACGYHESFAGQSPYPESNYWLAAHQYTVLLHVHEQQRREMVKAMEASWPQITPENLKHLFNGEPTE